MKTHAGSPGSSRLLLMVVAARVQASRADIPFHPGGRRSGSGDPAGFGAGKWVGEQEPRGN